MPDQFENFRAAVNGSKILSNRWDAVADSVIESAAREGITVSREEIMQLDAIRLHVLTGEEVGVPWRDEAETKIPAFMQKAESRRVMSALKGENADQKASAEIEILKKNPAERMRIARESGQQHAPAVTTKKNLSEGEKIDALRQLENYRGSEKIKMARKLGLE